MRDDRPLRSGTLASRAGVSTDTLRYYERRGLLARPPRDESGYRRYPQAALVRVRVIQQALDAGFTVEDLSRVLKQRDRGRGAVPGSPPDRARAAGRARRANRTLPGAAPASSGASSATGRSGWPSSRRPPRRPPRRAGRRAARCAPALAPAAGAETHAPVTAPRSAYFSARASARGSPSLSRGSRPSSDASSG